MTGNGADPASLRARARHYRDLAIQEPDPDRAALFRELARAFDLEAKESERNDE
jgi:hypothetical protein